MLLSAVPWSGDNHGTLLCFPEHKLLSWMHICQCLNIKKCILISIRVKNENWLRYCPFDSFSMIIFQVLRVPHFSINMAVYVQGSGIHLTNCPSSNHIPTFLRLDNALWFHSAAVEIGVSTKENQSEGNAMFIICPDACCVSQSRRCVLCTQDQDVHHTCYDGLGFVLSTQPMICDCLRAMEMHKV